MSVNPEFVEWVDDLSKGVRVLTLKNLILFLLLARTRARNINLREWQSRHPERRSHLMYNLGSYLAERDMIEVRYFASLLNWSIRTVFDYWETLRLIDVFTH